MHLRAPFLTSVLALLCWSGAAAQEQAYLIDTNLHQFFSVSLSSGAATLIANTTGVTTAADLAWRSGYNDLWTLDLSGGACGTIDAATGAFTSQFSTALSGWQGFAWDPFTQRFYASNQSGSNYVIDPFAQTTTLLGVGGAGYGLVTCLTADAAGNIWGLDFSSGNLGRMSKTTGVFTTVSVTAPLNMQGIAFDSLGRLFATNTTTDSLYSVNTGTGATTLIGAHGAGIQFVKGMAIAPQSIGAYLVDSSLGRLFWIDQKTGGATSIASTANNNLGTPAGLAWRQDTQELWTIDLAGGEVGTINVLTGTFTKKFDSSLSGWQDIAWDPTTQRFYAANQDGNNYVLNPASGTTTLLGAAGAGFGLITALAVDQSGVVWGIDFSTGNLGKMSKSTGAMTTVSTVSPANMQGMGFDILGKLYASNTTTDSLYLIDPTSGAATLVGAHNAGVTFGKGYTITRPETNAVIVDSNLGQLFSVSLTSGAASPGPGTGNHGLGTPADLAWRNGTQELFTVDLAGGEVGPINPATGEFTPYYIAQPTGGWQALAWDPSTARFYLANQDGNNYVLDPATGVTKLLGSAGFALLTGMDVDQQNNLWAIDFSGGGLVKVNKSTGVATLVTAVNVNNFQDIAFASNGRLYGENTTTDSLYSIDPTTGVATLIGANGAGVQFGKGFEIFTAGCTGTATTSGIGCADQTSTVLAMTSSGPPCIGSTIRVGTTVGAASYFLVLGFSNTVWSALPLPLSLAPFGAPGCTVYCSQDVQLGKLPKNATVGINIPNNPFLVGFSIYFQGIVLAPGMINALGVATSNLLTVKIGKPE